MTRVKRMSSEWLERHDAQLAAMRAHLQRERARLKASRSKDRKQRARALTPQNLAHAIRIAAKDAQQRPNHNPLYVEALEAAATYFDEICKRGKL
jgi:transcriptional/translational regulatory protein YebC/TACO1